MKALQPRPSIVLLYSPLIFDTAFGAVKPEGSLGNIYLAGALQDAGYEVSILDCAVGNDKYSLGNTFFREKKMPNGMVRVGMTTEEILKEIEPYDIVGLSSIFTAQTNMIVEIVRAIWDTYPEKLIILGGVNARSQPEVFFNAGADIICTGEAEKTIVEIADIRSRGSSDFRDVRGVMLMHDGKFSTTCSPEVLQNLDELPIPRWHMQPLDRYTKIARPHGGGFSDKHPVRYAPLMTSRGCPFKCHFCHITKELEGSDSGNLRKLRLKSHGRVMKEMHILKDLGMEHIFIEDDSLLGSKKRTMGIFKELIDLNLKLSGVNGVNIKHMCTREDAQGRKELGVDGPLLELMAQAGFTKIMLPVESGSRRIIKQYATDKLDLDQHDIVGLIKKIKSLGMDAGANYTFGYPDETEEEVAQTIALAERHMEAGLDNANFMIITPFPGTPLFDLVEEHGLWLPGVDITRLDWTNLSIKTIVPAQRYKEVIREEWARINKPERVNRIRSMIPMSANGNA